jgi:RND family efflux transporter MFP subunit
MKLRWGLLALAAFTVPALAADAPQAQGVARGADEALLSSEMAGRIVRIHDDGEAFHKGDVLAEFACDAQRAEEDVARAMEQGARAKLDNQRRLDAAKSAGQLDLALAEAQLAEGQARSRAAAAKVRLCRIAAPYDGVVLKREARPHESVNILAPLLRVARKGNLELTVIVPANWLAWLKPGAPLSFAAGATGARSEGKVVRVGGGVDPSSQTVEIKGELAADPTGAVKPGMAGAVVFRPGP